MAGVAEAIGPMHVLRLQDPEHASCSCGWTGTAFEAGVHSFVTITSSVDVELAKAAGAGLLPLQRD